MSDLLEAMGLRIEIRHGGRGPDGVLEPASLRTATGGRLARGALRARRAHAGVDRRARAAARPGAARPGCRSPAATTSAPGRSTCTCAASRRSARSFELRHGYVEATRRRPARRGHHARVPERRRDREHPDGRGARQGHDRARQRGARARDRRPRRFLNAHGRPRGRRRNADDHRRGVEPGLVAGRRPPRSPRPRRGGDVPGRARRGRRRADAARRPRPITWTCSSTKLGDMGMR